MAIEPVSESPFFGGDRDLSSTPALVSGDYVAAVRDGGADAVLIAAMADQREAHAREARKLIWACEWAYLHPILDQHGQPHLVRVDDPDLNVSGPGTPMFDPWAATEFGLVLGMRDPLAEQFIGQALELKHRLPQVWELIQSGRLPAWRGRLIAEQTIRPGFTTDAAAWVDRQVALVAGKLGPTALERLVREAAVRFQLAIPDDNDPHPCSDHDGRHVTLDLNQPISCDQTPDGLIHLDATLDLVDALDLNHALQHGAETLRRLGSDDTLDVRRALALGDLARHQTALNLFEHNTGEPTDTPGSAMATLPKARQLVLHVHLVAALTSSSAECEAGSGIVFDPYARVEHGQRLLALDVIKQWTGTSHTSITVRPVLDLGVPLHAAGYDIPQQLRDHVIARDGTCRFPWCTRAARHCDLDHVVPYDHSLDGDPDQPGPTSTDNLHALCRRHHRMKTTGGWHATMPTPGTTHWTSPHGHRFQVDHTGTTQLPTGQPTDSSGRRPPRPASR